MSYHVPVLLNECIEGLAIKPNGIYVDVTFGGGGHSREILKHLKNGKLFGFDQDADAEKNKPDDDRFIFVRQNFRFMKNFLKYYGIQKIDGLLADLGVSSHQLDVPERGFSFRFSGDLDSRMNQSSKTKASDILNTYSVDDLARIFKEYGELNNAKKIASVIHSHRQTALINTTDEFIDLLSPMVPQKIRHKFLAKVFQALRIEVNREMEFLETMLEQAKDFLAPGGRLVVLTYHSLEDRLVKNYIKKGVFRGQPEKDFYGNIDLHFKAINRSVITASEEELSLNNRSRSAKLRIAERI